MYVEAVGLNTEAALKRVLKKLEYVVFLALHLAVTDGCYLFFTLGREKGRCGIGIGEIGDIKVRDRQTAEHSSEILCLV